MISLSCFNKGNIFFILFIYAPVELYCSNLDEFFRVRVGSLMDQMLLNTTIRENKTNMTAQEQILKDAGVIVLSNNGEASRLAALIIQLRREMLS